MQNATKDLQPSEIRRGGVLGLNLIEGPTGILKQSGAITGTPSFTNNGIVLNGTTDYVTYALTGREFDSDEISIVLDISADFAWDDGEDHYLMDTDGGNYYLQKRSANDLRITLGGIIIVNADISSAWNDNGRNVIVVAGTDGATDAWVNGIQVVTADASAWSPVSATSLYLGASRAAAFYTPATVNSLKIIHGLLTQSEASAYATNSMFNYRNRAVIDLPMLAQDHDPSYTDSASEVLIDGDFEAPNFDNWTPVSNPTLTLETSDPPVVGSQYARIAYNDTASPYITNQDVTSGKVYRVRGYARSVAVAGTVTATVGQVSGWNQGVVPQVGAGSSGWVAFDVTFEATTTSAFYVRSLSANASGEYVEWDDITVEEVRPRTLDVSGNGNHALLGTAVPTTQPTKTTKHGYEFDSNDYLTIVSTGVLNSDEISFVIEFTPDFNWDENVSRYLFDTTAGEYYITTTSNGSSDVLQIFLGGTYIRNIPSATYSPYWRANQRNVLVISATTGSNNVWLNEGKILDGNAIAWTADNPAELVVGARRSYGNAFDGEIHSFSVYPFAINPTQVEAIKIQKAKEGNDV